MDITSLNAHHKLYASLLAALICLVFVYGRFTAPMQFIIVWIAFAVTQLGLSFTTIFSVHPIDMKKISKSQDVIMPLVFIFVLFAAIASLFVVVMLLSTSKSLSGAELSLHVGLSALAVLFSWALVHTIFIFRYAYLYYDTGVKGKKGSKYVEGLEFPEEKEPDYLDFAYFSFVIGMTFQVSDVEISSKRIRRLALIHSLISFLFNTVIVALSINIISGLTQK